MTITERYNAVMTAEEFPKASHQSPFRPFNVRMVDGRTFYVTHPDFVARSPTGRTIVIYTADGTHSVLDLRLISELEFPAQDDRAA